MKQPLTYVKKYGVLLLLLSSLTIDVVAYANENTQENDEEQVQSTVDSKVVATQSEEVAENYLSTEEGEEVNIEKQKKVSEPDASVKEEETESDSSTNAQTTESEIKNNDIATMTATELRAFLMGSVPEKISEVEVESYSDEQLTNGRTVTLRLMEDFGLGSHSAGYINTLSRLYVSKELSWDAISPMLTFDLKKYATFADLSQDLDQVYAYLVAFAPTTKNLTKENVQVVLTELEKEYQGQAILSSKLVYLIDELEKIEPKANEKKEEVKEVQKETSSSSPDKKVKPKGKTLPQTSEATEGIGLNLIGLAMVCFGIVWLKKN